jgi:hypothetical protein
MDSCASGFGIYTVASQRDCGRRCSQRPHRRFGYGLRVGSSWHPKDIWWRFGPWSDWPRRGRRRNLGAVVDKVRTDEVASSEGAEQGKLACHDSGSYDAGELLCVLTWLCRVRALYTKHLQHGLLRGEHCTTTDGADFYAGHCDGDKDVFTLIRSSVGLGERFLENTVEDNSQLH